MQSPFKFLDAYQREDLDQFFGREKETAQLYNAVHASNLTLLYGASGTGKTSLINCGLANKFYDTDWLPLFIRRDEDINTSFNDALRAALRSAPGAGFDDQPVRNKVRQLYLDHYKPIYLIFDQFEELFILGRTSEQKAFYQTVAQLLQAGLQAKVILIIREEWIAFLNEFEKYVPSLLDNRLRIERMNDRNIYRVIAGTARYHNIGIEEPSKTIMDIIQNLRDRHERVDLTNLQVYLDRLYLNDVKRQGGSTNQVVFDQQLVKDTGKLDDVLAVFLDDRLSQINRELTRRGVKEDDVALSVLAQLVTNDETKQPRLVGAVMDQLVKEKKNVRNEDIEYCIERLEDMRIIRYLEKG